MPELDVEPRDGLDLRARRILRRGFRRAARARPASCPTGGTRVAESATAESRFPGGRPNVIAQGTRIWAEPRGLRTIAPSAEPPAGGAPRRRATRRTTVEPSGLSLTRRGNGVIWSPPRPPASMRTRSLLRRDVVQGQELRRVPAVALSPTERERVRERGELGGRCAADVDEAGALGGDALVGQRPSRAREEALHIGGSEVRPRLSQQRGRARHHGGGRARAVHGPVARGAVVVAPGLRGREHDSRSGHVRLHARVEGEAARRERRDLRGRAVARGARDADRDDRVAVLGERIARRSCLRGSGRSAPERRPPRRARARRRAAPSRRRRRRAHRPRRRGRSSAAGRLRP